MTESARHGVRATAFPTTGSEQDDPSEAQASDIEALVQAIAKDKTTPGDSSGTQ